MLGSRRRRTTWAAFAWFITGAVGLNACSSDDDCTALNACSNLCGDPAYAAAHPDQCPLARGDAEAGVPVPDASDGGPGADVGAGDVPTRDELVNADSEDVGRAIGEADVSNSSDAS